VSVKDIFSLEILAGPGSIIIILVVAALSLGLASRRCRDTKRPKNKSSLVYKVIISVWILLLIALLATTTDGMMRAFDGSLLAGILATFSILFVSYFWLNGTKDIIYPLWFYFAKKRRLQNAVSRGKPFRRQPRILMTYCTYNDFNGLALWRSMRQKFDIGSVKVEILDDSTKSAYIKRVDKFAAKYGLIVRRRANHAGFKAGNINTHVLGRKDYDYLVLLDSDEVIPRNFCQRALELFQPQRPKHYSKNRSAPPLHPTIGIVQVNHVATNNRTYFQKRFHIGVDSHWPVYQGVKDCYGFLSLLGHGAMISRPCFEAAKCVPTIVAEDIGLSIRAREAGYLTVFDAETTCQEEFPVDYRAFRKRHSKWTSGNMEFIRTMSRTIFSSHQITWYEKLDILLFTYALPLTCIFFVFVIINVVAFPLVHVERLYAPWMIVPTVIFYFAPMINDVIFHWRDEKKRRLASYSVLAAMLYGGMFWTSLRQSFSSIFKKAEFTTTPKVVGRRMTLVEAVAETFGEWMLAMALVVMAMVFAESIWPVILLAIPAMMSTYLAVYHQR
jgi:cellulose synthase/poly-beta-1,6-N-acetylglucosamine synthase-like glycosyltransferase